MSKTAHLTAALDALREQRESAQKELSELSSRRSALEVERDTLMAQGLSQEDYATVVLMDIDRVADQCQIRMQERLASRAMYSTIDRRANGGFPAIFSAVLPVIENSPRNQERQHVFAEPLQAGMNAPLTLADGLPMDVAIYLFRDQIKAATRTAIMAIADWPVKHGFTLAQMRERLTEIAAETAELDASMGEIRAALSRFNG